MKKVQKSIKPAFLFILIVVVIVATIAVFLIGNKVSGKPSLIVNSDYETSFDLGRGYYAKFYGSVINIGKKLATDVEIICYLNRRGSLIESERRFIGDLLPAENIGFSMMLDYEGSDSISGNCKASCTNC